MRRGAHCVGCGRAPVSQCACVCPALHACRAPRWRRPLLTPLLPSPPSLAPPCSGGQWLGMTDSQDRLYAMAQEYNVKVRLRQSGAAAWGGRGALPSHAGCGARHNTNASLGRGAAQGGSHPPAPHPSLRRAGHAACPPCNTRSSPPALRCTTAWHHTSPAPPPRPTPPADLHRAPVRRPVPLHHGRGRVCGHW